MLLKIFTVSLLSLHSLQKRPVNCQKAFKMSTTAVTKVLEETSLDEIQNGKVLGDKLLAKTLLAKTLWQSTFEPHSTSVITRGDHGDQHDRVNDAAIKQDRDRVSPAEQEPTLESKQQVVVGASGRQQSNADRRRILKERRQSKMTVST